MLILKYAIELGKDFMSFEMKVNDYHISSQISYDLNRKTSS